MGKIWMPGGGGGTDLDVITAAAGDVLKGKVIVDTDGNPLTGTLELTGNAGTGDVLAGKTFYNNNAKSRQTGTMVDRGNWNSSDLAAGASVTIPGGKHGGSGKVTAKSLASQTGGVTAEDRYVYNGKTYWKDGVKRTGNMSVPSLLSFSVAAYSTSQVIATWKNPANGPFGGVIIRWKTGSYPTSVTDGSGYKGGGNNTSANGTSSTTISGLSAGTTYYFRIWPYCDTSAGTIYGSTRDATCKVTSHGSQTFTASGTWTCPAGVRTITRAFLVGGGGAGGSGDHSGNSKPWYGGGGGGGGYTTTVKNISVTPGQKYAVVVGSGGTPQTSGTGGTSSIAGIASANGGTNCLGSYGEDGGSGAGSGGESGSSGSGGNGGSDGGDGARNAAGMVGGKGQGSTTRKFGESGNTLYSGGGGGGGGKPHPGGAGGNGGGGAGGNVLNAGTNGAANTGGGGGGGGVNYVSDEHKSGGKGGSGIVIIEW